jgi:hypothetical protein
MSGQISIFCSVHLTHLPTAWLIITFHLVAEVGKSIYLFVWYLSFFPSMTCIDFIHFGMCFFIVSFFINDILFLFVICVALLTTTTKDSPLHVVIPREQLIISFARSGGPGGQHVNKGMFGAQIFMFWSFPER